MFPEGAWMWGSTDKSQQFGKPLKSMLMNERNTLLQEYNIKKKCFCQSIFINLSLHKKNKNEKECVQEEKK